MNERISIKNNELAGIRRNHTDMMMVRYWGMVCTMSQLGSEPDVTILTEDRLLLPQDPLPPYELDPAFDRQDVRKRIGEVIAKAMGRRISKR